MLESIVKDCESMADVCKQYTVEEASINNFAVCTYIDGVLYKRIFMSTCELEGCCRSIEQEGFERAFDVKNAKKRVQVAKYEYALALRDYEIAKKHALIVNNKRK